MAYSPRKAVTVDSVTYRDCGGVSSVTKSVTVGNNANRCLAIVLCDRGTGHRISNANFNGDALTLAIRATQYDQCYAEIWYLLAPDVGTHTLTVNFTANCQSYAHVGILSMYNVDQQDPLNATDSQSASASSGAYINYFNLDLNDCVVLEGQFNASNAAGNPRSGQVLIRKRNGNDSGGSSYKVNQDSGTRSVGWTGFSSSDSPYGSAVVAFQPAKKRKGGIHVFSSMMGM